MRTLAEITAAVELLPRHEQEFLRAWLMARLEASAPARETRLAALDALQTSLQLDAAKSRARLESVNSARH